MENTTASSDLRNLETHKVVIEGKAWDDEQVRNMVTKEMLIQNRAATYHQWLYDRGNMLFNRYIGKILDDDVRSQYEDIQQKIVIEPRIMKSPIRSLVGQIIKSRRSGQVTVEGGDSENPATHVNEVQNINIVLKDMEIRTREKYKIERAVHDSMVSCFPNVLYFDRCKPHDEDSCNGYTCVHLPWNSCMFGPVKYNEPDGSDIKEMWTVFMRSQSELIMNFPSREEQIVNHFTIAHKDNKLQSSIAEWEGEMDADDRNTIFDLVDQSLGTMTSPLGLVPVVQHLFPVTSREDIWINVTNDDEDDFVLKPPDWEDERWQEWLDANPVYQGPYERDITVLWTTVYTMSGLALENKKHWYQNYGKLPCSFHIPTLINGIPSGLAEDLAEDTLFNCVAEIERLDEIRKGTGKLLITREGSFSNIEELPTEISKAVGSLVLKKNAGPIAESITEIQRVPNPIWKEYGNERKQDMYDNTRINEAMQGATLPRQSAIAKNTEIAQALIVNAVYMDNLNLCWERHQNLKLSMIPYLYTEYEVIRIKDENTGNTLKTEVNDKQYDVDGSPISVVNDVTIGRYKYRLNPTDDSPTSQSQQTAEAMVILNALAGPMLSADKTGKQFITFLLSMPNPILNKMGKAMQADANMAQENISKAQQQESMAKAQAELTKAKAEQEKANKAGVSVSFTAEDFVRFPQMLAIYQQMVNDPEAMARMQQMVGAAAPAAPNPPLAGPAHAAGAPGVPLPPQGVPQPELMGAMNG